MKVPESNNTSAWISTPKYQVKSGMKDRRELFLRGKNIKLFLPDDG